MQAKNLKHLETIERIKKALDKIIYDELPSLPQCEQTKILTERIYSEQGRLYSIRSKLER